LSRNKIPLPTDVENPLQIHDHQRTHQPETPPAKYAETLLAVFDGEAMIFSEKIFFLFVFKKSLHLHPEKTIIFRKKI